MPSMIQAGHSLLAAGAGSHSDEACCSLDQVAESDLWSDSEASYDTPYALQVVPGRCGARSVHGHSCLLSRKERDHRAAPVTKRA